LNTFSVEDERLDSSPPTNRGAHTADSRRPTVDGRSLIVASARTWLGTPYHHAADIKGQGVDCAMILVRVFCDLGFVEHFDPRPYTADWFLHRDEERYMGHLLARAREVATPDAGDVMLFRIGRCFAHGGIVTRANPLTIIHAFAPVRGVVEDEVKRSAELRMRPHKFFSYWATTESAPRSTMQAPS
jgi:hypothetical protein